MVDASNINLKMDLKMDNKNYYIMVPSILIIILLFSYILSNHEDNTVKESIKSVDKGDIITNSSKKIIFKREQKKRIVYKKDIVKKYENEDSDAFIARIEKEISDLNQYKKNYQLSSDSDTDDAQTENNADVNLIEQNIIETHNNIMLSINNINEDY